MDLSGYKRYKETNYYININGDVYNNKAGRFVNGSKNNGYLMINLPPLIRNKQRRCYLHRMVAECFISNPGNLPDINHINGIKTDNRVINLEWITTQGNVTHALRNGLLRTGCDSVMASLTKPEVDKIRLMKDLGYNGKKISSKLGFKYSAVLGVLNGKTYKKEFGW